MVRESTYPGAVRTANNNRRFASLRVPGRVYPAVYSLFLLFALLACGGTTSAQAPPDPTVLWEQATVYRDEWGVPHIQSENTLAMAFAFGYAQADDHIEGMLKAYRVANGRAAEVYGEEFAASDEFALKMGHADLALAAFPYADAITRDLCNGFALGVNAWLIQNPARAPEWADGVRPEDILALMHCYLMSFAPFDLPGGVGRPPAANTGNAWAIGPSRSQNGETILVINPHTDYRSPFQWYEAQLTCGSFNVYGATLFGLPMILQGHNGTLGWALTPNMTDFADMYLEPDQKIRQTKPGTPSVKAGGQVAIDADTLRYLEMVSNAKTYYVRTAAGMEERKVPFLETQHGPVVGKYNNRFCSYQIGGYRDFGALSQLYQMAASANEQQFGQAVAMRQLPSFHIIYADREGNINYLYNSKVGMKATPPPPEEQLAANRQQKSDAPLTIISWNAPVPANDTRFAWGDLIPLSDLPAVHNPKSGYVQACGNPPWLATDDSGIDAAKIPKWFALDSDTFRAKRARRLLSMGARSFQDAQAMLYDVVVPGAMYGVPKLLDAADAKKDLVANAHPDLAPYLDALRNWNYVAEPSSEGMTLFHMWWNGLCTVAPKGSSEFAIWQELEANSDRSQSFALQAAEEAAKKMRSEFQTLSKTWGDVHVFVRGDKRVPAPGSVSGQPMFVASDYVFEDGAWKVTYGYGFAMAVDFGQRTEAASMVPFGASETPGTPHYDDQMQLVQDRRLKPTRFEPEEVRRFADSAYGSVVRIAPRGMEAQFTVRSESPVTVSTRIDTKPPATVPKGLATFTVYAQIDQQPVEQQSIVELNVYIPEEICTQSNLGQLALYAYDTLQGWAPVETQQMNMEARVIVAEDRKPRIYAVLGPTAARIAPDVQARTRMAKAVADPKPLIAQAETTLPPRESATTPPPKPEDMIASATGAPPMESATPRAMISQSEPGATASAAPPTDTAQQAPVPEPAADKSAPPSAEPSGSPSGEPAAAKKEPEPFHQTMPIMQAGLPKGPVVQKSKEGALAWGTKIQLRPPGVEGLVLVTAEKQVGARLSVTPEASPAIPDGLAPYTQFVRVDLQGESVPVKVTVHLRPDRDADSLGALQLYALDGAQGWVPMAGQSRDDAKRDFTATDSTARTYVLLGPKK